MIVFSTCTVFLIAVSSLEDWAKKSESLSFLRTRERKSKYAVNVQCTVQYTLLTFYLILIPLYA
jgi:hypothetical protein